MFDWITAERIIATMSVVSAFAFIAAAVFACLAWRSSNAGVKASRETLELARADRQEAEIRHRMETRNPRELTLKMRQLLCVNGPWDTRKMEGIVVFFGANHLDENGSWKYASYPVEDYAETMNTLSLYGLVEGKVEHTNMAIWSLTQYGILNQEILISKGKWENGNSNTDNTQRSSVVI